MLDLRKREAKSLGITCISQKERFIQVIKYFEFIDVEISIMGWKNS
jgi:hypothetical protein